MQVLPEPSLRQQLMDARACVQRHVETLQARNAPEDLGAEMTKLPLSNSVLIVRLTEALREIDGKLARLGPDDS